MQALNGILSFFNSVSILNFFLEIEYYNDLWMFENNKWTCVARNNWHREHGEEIGPSARAYACLWAFENQFGYLVEKKFLLMEK